MFQYVRQAENRWLGKTYILRLNDGNNAYAMDISDLTPEQSADLEERYYNQLTIDHESVVKSNGILELEASQKTQFPTNVGNVFFVELINTSIKHKKCIDIPSSILQRLQYFKKLVSIIRDLFLQEISHGDMFEECIEIFHSETSEGFIDIYISGFGRNSGDIVATPNLIGNHSFFTKRHSQLAYERDISFLSMYFQKIFNVNPNQEEICFFPEIVAFRESLQVHQFTILELYDHIHALLQTCQELWSTQNQREVNIPRIENSSLHIDTSVAKSDLPKNRRNELKKTEKKEISRQENLRSRKSQIFSAKASTLEEQFSADYFEKLRSKNKEQGHIDTFDSHKKRVIRKRQKNAFASKEAQIFVQKIQTFQIEPVHSSLDREEIPQKNTLQEKTSIQDIFSNDLTPSSDSESVITNTEEENKEEENKEEENKEDIFSQTIPSEELQSPPSISFRENTSYIQSQETSDLKSLEVQVFEDISELSFIEQSPNSENSELPTNTHIVIPVQQSKEEQIVSKKTTPSQKSPSDFPSTLSTEKDTSSISEEHGRPKGSKLDSDFFFSSIMEKIQKNELTNGEKQSQKTTSDSDVREPKERNEHRPQNIFDPDMDQVNSPIHNEIQDISIDDIPQLSSVSTDSTPSKHVNPFSENLSQKVFERKPSEEQEDIGFKQGLELSKNTDHTIIPDFSTENQTQDHNPFLSVPLPKATNPSTNDKTIVPDFVDFSDGSNGTIPELKDLESEIFSKTQQSFFTDQVPSENQVNEENPFATQSSNPDTVSFEKNDISNDFLKQGSNIEQNDDDPFGFFQTENQDVQLEPSVQDPFTNEESVQNDNPEQGTNHQINKEKPKQKDLWFQEQQHEAYLQGMNVSSGSFSSFDDSNDISSSSSHKKIAIGVGLIILILLYVFVWNSPAEIEQETNPTNKAVETKEQTKEKITDVAPNSDQNNVSEEEMVIEKKEDVKKEDIKKEDLKEESSDKEEESKSKKSNASSYKKEKDRETKRERERRKQRERERRAEREEREKIEREREEKEQKEREEKEQKEREEQREREEKEQEESTQASSDNPWLQESGEEEQEENAGPVGTVRRKGDKVKILLKGDKGEVGIGSVPTGSYEVLVKFSGSKNYKSFGSLTVEEGGSYKIICNNMSRTCDVK